MMAQVSGALPAFEFDDMDMLPVSGWEVMLVPER